MTDDAPQPNDAYNERVKQSMENMRSYRDALPEGMRRRSVMWIVASVTGSIAWPTTFEEVPFRGRTVYLTPSFGDLHPSVCMTQTSEESFGDSQRVILQFLSSLAWQHQQPIRVVGWTGGSYPAPSSRYSIFGNTITHNFDASDLPDPTDEKTRWAMAFYREGLSLEHAAYSFLSFYKIINLIRPKGGKSQKAWISDNLEKVTNHLAKERIKELGPDPVAVADYLYSSNRCAIAHAGDGVTVDPENSNDERRLSQDAPLIKNLAEVAIEQEFGVKTAQTLWREHLYELDGFRILFGEKLTAKLKNKEDVEIEEIPNIPDVSVGLKKKDAYGPLQNLEVFIEEISDGIVLCQCASRDMPIAIRIALNFPDERLQFDPINGLYAADLKTAESMRNIAETLRFQCEYFANGCLEIKDANTGNMLGRCDAFIPRNIELGGTLRNMRAGIEETLAEATKREQAELLSENVVPP